MDIYLIVMKLIALETGRDIKEIRPEQSLVKGLKLDNPGLFSLVYNLEEIFGIEIPNEIMDKFKTVRYIIDYIESIPKEPNWKERAKGFIISYNPLSHKQTKDVLKGLDIIMEQYYWRHNWRYKKFREKLQDCIMRLFYNPRRFYYKYYSPQEDALRRTFNQRLEEIKKRPKEKRYTGLLGFPGSYEEAFIEKAGSYSKKLVKKILKRKVSPKSIVPEIERAAFRLWYAHGLYLHKDLDEMMKEQLDLIREEITNNKYISGWDEDLTEELVGIIEEELRTTSSGTRNTLDDRP